MGCDIHIAFEMKRDGKWVHFGTDSYFADDPRLVVDVEGDWVDAGCKVLLDNGRWIPSRTTPLAPLGDRFYPRFSRLAGVRGGGMDDPKPIRKPRGLPRNAALETIEYLKGDDYHSYSYLDVALILSVADWPVDSWPFGGKCKFRECLERVVLPRTCGHEECRLDIDMSDPQFAGHAEACFAARGGVAKIAKQVRLVFAFDN